MAQSKYYIVSANGREYCCPSPMDVYYAVLKYVYDVDAKTVDEETHMKAAEAESWCEEPWGDEFTSCDYEFTVRIADAEED